MSMKKCHEILSHVDDQSTKETAKKYGWELTDKNMEICDACARAKIKGKLIAKITKLKARRTGQRLGIDISSMNTTSLGGSKFMGVVIDDFSDYGWVVFLKNKSQLWEKVLPIIKKLSLTGKSVEYIRCDNAGENKVLQRKCLDEGFDIQFEFTPPGKPQYNGKCERWIAYIWSQIRASFIGAGIPKDKGSKIWTECAATVMKTKNITVRKYTDKCAHEKMEGKLPNYIYSMKRFGEMAIVKDNRSNIKSKLEDRGIEAMFVGYSDDHGKGVYRFLNIRTGRIIISKDIIFLDKTYGEYRNMNQREVHNSYESEIFINEDTKEKVRFQNETEVTDDRENETEDASHDRPNIMEDAESVEMTTRNARKKQHDQDVFGTKYF